MDPGCLLDSIARHRLRPDDPEYRGGYRHPDSRDPRSNLHDPVPYTRVDIFLFALVRLGGNIQKYLRGELSDLSKLRLAQNFTGLALIVAGFFVSITRIDWFKLGLGWLFPFKRHINYDVFLTVSGILHVAIGVNFGLKRRRHWTKDTPPIKVISPKPVETL